MSYLLDTNIISETAKIKPNQNVLKWLDDIPNDSLFLSVITIGEIRKGVELLNDSKKKNKINTWLEVDLINYFQGRIINIDFKVAEKWGYLTARYKNLPAIDGLLAASALAYNLKLVTRNVEDFTSIHSLEVVNPF